MLDWKDLPSVDGRIGWPWAPRDPNDPDFIPPSLESTANETPSVLVVTPSFNQGAFLEQTIRSVLLQGYPNLVYRVIDGGSTDESAEIIDRYGEWLDFAVSEPDQGQSDAIMKGIRQDESGWFGWINSDDWLAPHTLCLLESRDALAADMVGMSIQVVGDGASYPMENRNLSASTMLREGDYSFAQPGLWFRLKHYHACGGIDSRFQYGFDWDLVVRYLAIHPTIHSLDHVGAYFRVHEASKTSIEGSKEVAESRFEQEHAAVRTKLENTLVAKLAADSQWGRRVRRWRQSLESALDDHRTSPLVASVKILGAAWRDPSVRFRKKTWTTILRLLSRYIRPKSSWA